MTHHTDDEVLQEYQAKMGAALGAEFHRLWNECAWLHQKWQDYCALFGTKRARVDLLNAAASGHFLIVNETTWNDLILHVCRLTDPPPKRGRDRERLSIRRLTAQVDRSIHDKVRVLVAEAIKNTEFARDWRDRHVAHRDLRLAMKQGAKPLAPASRQNMREAIGAIGAVLGAVEAHYCNNTTTAYALVSLLGDAEALLYVLRDGLEARDEEMRQLQAGQLPPGGFKTKRPI